VTNPGLHPLARGALAELAARGVVLDPADDFHHLTRLDLLARTAAGASNDWKTRRTWFPTVGTANVTLRRLSIGARLFLAREVFPNIDPGDRAGEIACIAFVMAHCADPERHLWPLAGNVARFSDAVTAWLCTVGATWPELDEAVAKLLQDGPDELPPLPRKGTPTEPNFGAICGALAESYGRDPEWWFWHASEELVSEMLGELDKQAEAARPKSGTAIAAPDPNSTFLRARRALSEYRDAIEKEKKAPHG
jgi:hypothetical protein